MAHTQIPRENQPTLGAAPTTASRVSEMPTTDKRPYFVRRKKHARVQRILVSKLRLQKRRQCRLLRLPLELRELLYTHVFVDDVGDYSQYDAVDILSCQPRYHHLPWPADRPSSKLCPPSSPLRRSALTLGLDSTLNDTLFALTSGRGTTTGNWSRRQTSRLRSWRV